MFSHWRYRRRCSAISQQCARSDVAAYTAGCAALNVGKLVNTPLISVDLEMTGLDAAQNQIIAIGWTQMDHGRIRLASSRHILVSAEQSVGHSAAVHELMDKDVAGGVPLETGLESLFEAAKGRVWVFHHAALDVAFLRKACLAWAGVSMPFMVVDTMLLELTLRKRRNLPIHHGDLQLVKLRANYNLPGYTAHNALIDACATAELLLAIADHMDTTESLNLRPYLNYY